MDVVSILELQSELVRVGIHLSHSIIVIADVLIMIDFLLDWAFIILRVEI